MLARSEPNHKKGLNNSHMKQQDIQGVILIGGLAAAGYVLFNASKGISTATQGAGAGIATAATGAGMGISQATQGLGAAISGVSGTVDRTIRKTADTANSVIADVASPTKIIEASAKGVTKVIEAKAETATAVTKSRGLRKSSVEDFKTTTTQASLQANKSEEIQRKTEYGATVGQYLAKVFTPTASVAAERQASLKKTVNTGVSKVTQVLSAPVKAAQTVAQKATTAVAKTTSALRSAVGSITGKLTSWF